MNKINLNTLLKLAVVLGFLGIPVEADAYAVVASNPALVIKVGELSALTADAFGSYGNVSLSKISYAEGELTPGLAKEGGLQLPGRDRFEGTDCAKTGGFSKVPFKTCPTAGSEDPALKTREVVALVDASLKEKVEGLKEPETQRVKRVSRLQEPGEAMGGGREKHLKEDAEMLKAQGK